MYKVLAWSAYRGKQILLPRVGSQSRPGNPTIPGGSSFSRIIVFRPGAGPSFSGITSSSSAISMPAFFFAMMSVRLMCTCKDVAWVGGRWWGGSGPGTLGTLSNTPLERTNSRLSNGTIHNGVASKSIWGERYAFVSPVGFKVTFSST